MGLLPSLLTTTSKNTFVLEMFMNIEHILNMFPRRAPQTAGHRCDFGLGPIGPYRALPIQGGGGNPSRQVNPSRRAVSCGVAPPLVNDT